MKYARDLSLILLFIVCSFPLWAARVHLRVNQLGYLPAEGKVAIAFSEQAIRDGHFQVRRTVDGGLAFDGPLVFSAAPSWGRFGYHYELDFSGLQVPGRYYLQVGEDRSVEFPVGEDIYAGVPGQLLAFMQQQRCGYNPFLDMVCHQRDGRSQFGPMPDSTYVDAAGGWHDAGDQLKYLITGSNATAQMLLAYELFPSVFGDVVNALGQPGANGIPDMLDEARWGLDWIFRLHPAPDQLIHQVADDRDHRGWKWPDQDPSDYGWGANSYRVAYFADGKPQGAGKYLSKATGLANIAGRSAAAMAIGARVWKALGDTLYAAQCARAARSLYALGKAHEGYQQGNSYGAPYRYTEDTWADDMEWAAAELFRNTGEEHYHADAWRYAALANTETSWMPFDTADHYRFYPFLNMGHYALYDLVGEDHQARLAAWYRQGIEDCLQRARGNNYAVGAPFIWCSNNLIAALATQILLYERMTGDSRYRPLLEAQRDWLLGRNPWGTSMFTGIPADGEYPLDVHTSVWVLTRRMVPGGLIDGPIRMDIYRKQLGLTLTQADEFAHLQNPAVVYHDDNGDYATNEPTMDGTAIAFVLFAWLAAGGQ